MRRKKQHISHTVKHTKQENTYTCAAATAHFMATSSKDISNYIDISCIPTSQILLQSTFHFFSTSKRHTCHVMILPFFPHPFLISSNFSSFLLVCSTFVFPSEASLHWWNSWSPEDPPKAPNSCRSDDPMFVIKSQMSKLPNCLGWLKVHDSSSKTFAAKCSVD